VTHRAVVAMSDFGEDVGDVGLVEGRESETLLAEVVSDGLRECHFGAQIAVFKPNHATLEAEPCTSASGTMQVAESNHALARVQPCKLPSGTMQVCECMVPLARFHPLNIS